MEEASIIDENDTILNASGYFIVDHELEYWQIWLFMNTLLYFLRINFTINRMFEMIALVVGCISQLH